MSESVLNGMDRRAFLNGILPACAMTCVSLRGPFGPPCAAPPPGAQEPPHRWDVPVDPAPTPRQLEVARIRRFLQFAE